MTTIRRLYSVVFIAILFIANAERLDCSQPKIAVVLDDSVFLLREAIWVTVTMTNTTPAPIDYSQFYFEGNILLSIRDSNEKIYEYDGVMSLTSGSPRMYTLHPGESITRVGNIHDYYGVREANYPGYNYLPASGYSLSACVVLSGTVKLCSEEVKFKVLEPKGEEKIAHDLLVDARKTFLLARGNERTTASQRASNYYEELLSRFPQSRYATQGLYESAGVNFAQQKDNYEKNLIKLMESYPDSRLAERSISELSSYWDATSRKTQSKLLLQNILTKFPKTRIGAKAKELIKLKEE